MAKVKKTFEITSDNISEIKRFYSGIQIKTTCPDCKGEMKYNGDEYCLIHPSLDEIQYINFYCKTCDENHYMLPVKLLSLNLEVEYDLNELKKES